MRSPAHLSTTGKGDHYLWEDKLKELGGAETYTPYLISERKIAQISSMAGAAMSKSEALGPFTQMENTLVPALTQELK